jgi:hypothetical protein
VFSHSSPQSSLTASLGDKVRLATLALALVTAWLSAAGCAGTQAYVPFERETKVSAAARWQALESVAKHEQWKVVRSDPQAYTIVAYTNPSGASGVRDRIKVELLSDRTVVETQSEIEDQGRWEANASRCASYESVREKLLAAQIDGSSSQSSQSAAASTAVPRKLTELAAR